MAKTIFHLSFDIYHLSLGGVRSPDHVKRPQLYVNFGFKAVISGKTQTRPQMASDNCQMENGFKRS
jgi:hypothetical protein